MTLKKSVALLVAALCAATAVSSAPLDPASRAALRRHQITNNSQSSARHGLRAVVAPRPALSALIQLADGATAADLEADGVNVLGSRHGFAFATVTADAAEELASNPAVARIELDRSRNLKMNVVRTVAGIDKVHSGIELPAAYTGKGVVCGIIDSGFDPNHPNFLDPSGKSRFAYFADVSLNPAGTSIVIKEYSDEQIARLKTDDYSTYHGTHTTGIMAGSHRGTATVAQLMPDGTASTTDVSNPYYGAAYDAEIAASTGVTYDGMIAYALDGILEWRWNNRHYNPVVVNMSLGGNQGPHDGSSIICEFMDKCALYDNAIICLAAGNEGDVPLHIDKTLSADDNTLKSFIHPYAFGPDQGNIRYGVTELYANDDTPFELQAVIYNKARGRVTCRMPITEKPEGIIQYWCSSAEYQWEDTDIVDSNFARAFEGYVGVVSTFDEGSGRFYCLIDFYTRDNQETNADGNYVLGFEVVGVDGQRVDCYTDGMYTSLASYDIEGWSAGSCNGTVSDMSTGYNTITVGAYNVRQSYPMLNGSADSYSHIPEGDYTAYSSYGTLADGRNLPHLCAPGATVISSVSSPFVTTESNNVDPGMLQAKVENDMREGYYMQAQGTSMATPVVAGTVALMLEANPELTFSEVRDILMSTAVKDSHYQSLSDKTQAGAGKLDAHAAVKAAASSNRIKDVAVDETCPIVTSGADKSLEIVLPGSRAIDAALYSISGVRVIAASAAEDHVKIDASSLSTGVYVLQVNGHSMRIAIR